jgi:hypothetical protein
MECEREAAEPSEPQHLARKPRAQRTRGNGWITRNRNGEHKRGAGEWRARPIHFPTYFILYVVAKIDHCREVSWFSQPAHFNAVR